MALSLSFQERSEPVFDLFLVIDDDAELARCLKTQSGRRARALPTVGDGACSYHSVYGDYNLQGQLFSFDARRRICAALEPSPAGLRRRYVDSDLAAKLVAIDASLRNELAVPGVLDSDESSEARCFMSALRRMNPGLAAEAEEAARARRRAQQDEAAARGKVVTASRSLQCSM
jgi:hypothetical protein